MAEWRDASDEQKKVRPRPAMSVESAVQPKINLRNQEYLKVVLVSFVSAVTTVIGVGLVESGARSSLSAMAVAFHQTSIDVKQVQADVKALQRDLQRQDEEIQNLNKQLANDENRFGALVEAFSRALPPTPNGRLPPGGPPPRSKH